MLSGRCSVFRWVLLIAIVFAQPSYAESKDPARSTGHGKSKVRLHGSKVRKTDGKNTNLAAEPNIVINGKRVNAGGEKNAQPKATTQAEIQALDQQGMTTDEMPRLESWNIVPPSAEMANKDGATFNVKLNSELLQMQNKMKQQQKS